VAKIIDVKSAVLEGLPSGDSVLDFRDRAIIKFFLYSGARIGTACRLTVKDFHQDGDEATITLHQKGDKHRRVGLHFNAAEAISEYIKKAELKRGPLFRARKHWRLEELGAEPMCVVTMYNLLQGYLTRLPGSMREEEVMAEDGSSSKVIRCAYTSQSLRGTTATLLCAATKRPGGRTPRPGEPNTGPSNSCGCRTTHAPIARGQGLDRRPARRGTVVMLHLPAAGDDETVISA
jgi:hypothetical protein